MLFAAAFLFFYFFFNFFFSHFILLAEWTIDFLIFVIIRQWYGHTPLSCRRRVFPVL